MVWIPVRITISTKIGVVKGTISPIKTTVGKRIGIVKCSAKTVEIKGIVIAIWPVPVGWVRIIKPTKTKTAKTTESKIWTIVNKNNLCGIVATTPLRF